MQNLVLYTRGIDITDKISDQIKNALENVAMEDGVISIEERILINTIIEDMQEYKTLLEMALEDGVITDMERTNLFEKRMAIMEKGYEVARDDSLISNDEASLLQSVCKIILDLGKQERG